MLFCIDHTEPVTVLTNIARAMCYPEWFNEYGIAFSFTPYDTRKFRGSLLRGSVTSRAETKQSVLFRQQWSSGLYRIGFYSIDCILEQQIVLKQVPGTTRLEAVIDGELVFIKENGTVIVGAGQYQIVTGEQDQLRCTEKSACHYFSIYYSDELLNEFGIGKDQVLCEPRPMPERMLQLLVDSLQQPHSGTVADIYYRKLVAEVLFIHLTSAKLLPPGELSGQDLAAIHEADAILARDLSEHYTIRELSAMAGTNAYKLKKGFRLVFKMGVFARLLYRRMEHAKVLLETTSKPVKEVAFESGYSSVGAFIQAFRRRFKLTPLEWREKVGGL